MNKKAIPLNKANVIVVGVARNCARTLRSRVAIIERAFRNALNVSWLIVESDSTDRTLEILQELKRERHNFNYDSLGTLRAKYPNRTERIALCRNHYLKFVQNDFSQEKVDYVVVADLDHVNEKLDSTAIGSCWNRTDWDVCCANQTGLYYDIWALRHPLWSPNDCWAQARMLQNYGMSRMRAISVSVHARMLRIPENADWIEVDSAFGGIAIYQRSALNGAAYLGIGIDGTEVCEHVALHKTIKSNGGRIFINPRFINSGRVEHVSKSSGLRLAMKWIGSDFRSLINRLKSWC